MYQIVIRIVKRVNTEKSNKVQENNVYVFLVPVLSRKGEIKKIIEKTFSVKVDTVNTINMPLKICGFRGKKGIKSNYKKAYVKVAKGMKIEEDNQKKDSENK